MLVNGSQVLLAHRSRNVVPVLEGAHTSSARSSATCCIALGPVPGQASVQASGVVALSSAAHEIRVALFWPAQSRAPQGGERLKRGLLCWK